MEFRSPAYDLQRARGARFEPHQSWEIAQHYGAPSEEYEALRASAGAIDLSYLGLLRATGTDRTRYLHGMLSNDIKKLTPGKGCHATLLTNQGHMESDLYVYAFREDIYMECPPAGKDRILANLTKYLVGDAVELEDLSGKMGILSIQGSRSREAMQELVGLSLEGLDLLEHSAIERQGSFQVVIHRDRCGCDGYDLWLPRNELRETWDQWIRSERITPVGYEPLNWLRTEAGIPWYGVDMDDHDLPLEFGLGTAISLNKGCYRGQEIMARITYRGHLNRGFCGIAVHQSYIPPRGTEVRAQGGKIGKVTSAIFSPRLHCPLALAVLKNEFLKPGTSVGLVSNDGLIPGEVIALPLTS